MMIRSGRAPGPTGSEQPRVLVTTSWDDGHVLDECLADLLNRYEIPGTFYLAPRNVELAEGDRLTPRAIAALADSFEIGGHTLTHRRLPTLPDAEAREEIQRGKEELEQIIGRRLGSFCYPCGAYSRHHPAMVAESGFAVARTVRRWVTEPTPPLEMDTTVNAYRHLVDGVPALKLARGRGRSAGRLFWNWDQLAMAVFDEVVTRGGIFHLWGHSWEIDQNKDWSRLERVLAYIQGRPGVEYVDNATLHERTVSA